MDKMTLEQFRTVWYSEAGTPIMSQMICSGNGAAMSVTKSPVP